MTRLAVFSDVHGNVEALRAVRKAIKVAKPDAVLVAGDLVMNGPDPIATLEELRELDGEGALIIQGNTDVAVADFDYAAAFPWLTDGVPEAFRAAASRYGGEIDVVDGELVGRYGSIPPERRKLVTNHDAFGYLAHRYGLEVVGTVIPSTSTAAEPNARDTVALIEAIRREGVPGIFSESSVDPKLGRQVAAETGVGIYADLLGDTLAPEGQPGADYLSMMRRNADIIVKGLTG